MTKLISATKLVQRANNYPSKEDLEQILDIVTSGEKVKMTPLPIFYRWIEEELKEEEDGN